jgi:hypothetical protein
VISLVALYFVARYYVDTLLGDPIGRLAAVAGGVLVIVGLYLNNRIAQIEY